MNFLRHCACARRRRIIFFLFVFLLSAALIDSPKVCAHTGESSSSSSSTIAADQLRLSPALSHYQFNSHTCIQHDDKYCAHIAHSLEPHCSYFTFRLFAINRGMFVRMQNKHTVAATVQCSARWLSSSSYYYKMCAAAVHPFRPPEEICMHKSQEMNSDGCAFVNTYIFVSASLPRQTSRMEKSNASAPK